MVPARPARCARCRAVDDASFSPDGRWIAFTSRTREARYDAKDERWQAPRKVETFFSRLDNVGWTFDRPKHVYLVAAHGTGGPRNLTPGSHQHAGVAWLADSSGVVTAAARHDGWDRDRSQDLYAVALDGEIRAITHGTGVYASPAVSPDGRSVAFLGSDDPLTHPQNVRGRCDRAGRRGPSLGVGRARSHLPADRRGAGARLARRRHPPRRRRGRRRDPSVSARWCGRARPRAVDRRRDHDRLVRCRRWSHRACAVDGRAPVRDPHPRRPGHQP